MMPAPSSPPPATAQDRRSATCAYPSSPPNLTHTTERLPVASSLTPTPWIAAQQHAFTTDCLHTEPNTA